MSSIETCRLCKKTNYDGPEPLFKYGVRHYVHASCGLEKWGEKFLDMIPAWQLQHLPYGPLVKHGLLEKVEERAKAVQS